MSVLATKRKETELQVLTLAYNLAEYTLKKVKNEKYYPKNQRWILANRTANCVLDALIHIQSANETPTSTPKDLEIRRELQVKANNDLLSLLQLIRLASNLYVISPESIEYRSGLALETDIKLKAWMKADKDRYY